MTEVILARKGGVTPDPIFSVEYLIVGGGAGGAYNNLAGWPGAGGGFVTATSNFQATATTYAITIGAGGVGKSAGSYGGGTSGQSSSFLSLTAGGGLVTGLNTGISGSPQSISGGNSGAGGTGTGGNGGPGLESTIDGLSYLYGASGGSADGLGGLDGGGDGAKSGVAGQNGEANSGGGGGGGAHKYGQPAGSGGSGVVILRTLATASATTGSPTVTTDGSYNIYTFTASGSITF